MELNRFAVIVTNILDETVPTPNASLKYTSPFELLIATLLSAQCRDEQVNHVMPKLLARANTPETMRLLSENEIGQLIYSCGFYKVKAHYISVLSQQLCDQFGGHVPNTFKALESLMGIGHKTASVIMGYAFKQPAFPVDTHIHRVSMKWHLSPGPSVERVEHDLKRLFPPETWFKRHLQMITFGRSNCNHIACTALHPCMICQAIQDSQIKTKSKSQ